MENCENFRHATHAQNDTPVDTPSIPRALARVANVRPSAFAYKRLRVWFQCCVCVESLSGGFRVRAYSESAWARVVTAKRVHRALSKFARSRSEGALTRAILAEGSLGTLRICTVPQRERCGTRNPRRGFIGHFTNLHGATARALWHAQSSQRVHRALYKFARHHSGSASRRAIPAEGSSGTA